LAGFDEAAVEFPETFAKEAFFEGDGEAEFTKDFEVAEYLTFAALEAVCQFVGGDAEMEGLKDFEEVPLAYQ
jgi:hypothetical protein